MENASTIYDQVRPLGGEGWGGGKKCVRAKNVGVKI